MARLQTKEDQQSAELCRTIKGRRIISSMKRHHELLVVYWKHPSKLIFLEMIFLAISESMVRKGYSQSWMKELPLCIKATDQKLNFIARRSKLGRVFKALKDYLDLEREKTTQVRLLQGHRVLKQLLTNEKVSILKQKEDLQTQQLT